MNDSRLINSIREIKYLFGNNVDVIPKNKFLFGKIGSLVSGVTETIWGTGGFETFTPGNAITEVVSSNSGDTQNCLVSGHTISGGVVLESDQIVTLNGVTPVNLSPPLHSVTFLQNIGNNPFVGNITARETGGTIRLTALAADNVSKKAQTMTANNEYWLIRKLVLSTLRSEGVEAKVDFEFQIRTFGSSVWINIYSSSCTTTAGTIDLPIDPLFIVSPQHYFRVNATSSANNVAVTIVVGGNPAVIRL